MATLATGTRSNGKGEARAANGARTVPHLTVSERVARGKAARQEVPRARHVDYTPSVDRADPVEVLERQLTDAVRAGKLVTETGV